LCIDALLVIYMIIAIITDGIVKTMKSKAGPSSKELVTVADAEKFLANTEHSIVGEWTINLFFLSIQSIADLCLKEENLTVAVD